MGHMIDLVSVEGGIPLKINRFILQLHNTFFHSLLLEHQHQDLVIIFSDTEISELKAMKASVLEKHILIIECTKEYNYEILLSLS